MKHDWCHDIACLRGAEAVLARLDENAAAFAQENEKWPDVHMFGRGMVSLFCVVFLELQVYRMTYLDES